MTALKQALIRQIRAQGPITIAEFMTQCLLHPKHGYYATRDPFGTRGDFITAPEISQMFGEMLGLLVAQVWMDQGAPARFALAELGPGRGTLMADMLRATRRVPGFHDALALHLVEMSPVLRDAQARALRGFGVQWHEDVTTLPQMPLFLVANEFFDALPIRQFLRIGTAWAERMIGIDGDGLRYGLSPASARPDLDARADVLEGQMVETRAAADPIMAELAQRIDAHGGFALVIDYGDWRSLGDTFQALRAHQPDDPLAHPGAADVTAHVAFAPLAAAAAPLQATALTPQGVLLQRLGIMARAQALAQNLAGAARAAHESATRRLTDAQEMGHLFKALGLYPNGAPAPPGFD